MIDKDRVIDEVVTFKARPDIPEDCPEVSASSLSSSLSFSLLAAPLVPPSSFAFFDLNFTRNFQKLSLNAGAMIQMIGQHLFSYFRNLRASQNCPIHRPLQVYYCSFTFVSYLLFILYLSSTFCSSHILN